MPVHSYKNFQDVLRSYALILSQLGTTIDICDHVMQANVDLAFLCETWLRPKGDESDCAAFTAPGFCLKSFPRQSGAGGGLAVLYRNSLTYLKKKKKKDGFFSQYINFTAFEICKVRISHENHDAVCLSVCPPPPSPFPVQSKEHIDKCNTFGTVFWSAGIMCCLWQPFCSGWS